MQHWEYLTLFVDANPVKAKLPKQPGWAIFAPEYLKPQLDALGAEGWELISIHPVEVGQNGDTLIPGSGRETHWAHEYVCVFKRPVP